MASTKKKSEKKTSKKTSKKAPKKTTRKTLNKKKNQEDLKLEKKRHKELAKAVVAATAEFAGDVQRGKVKGFILLGITDNPETDLIRFAGATPPDRVQYLLELAKRISMDNALRAINANNAAKSGG